MSSSGRGCRYGFPRRSSGAWLSSRPTPHRFGGHFGDQNNLFSLAKLFTAQAPALRLVTPAVFGSAARLHTASKLFASSRTVLRDAPLAQKPIHPQPCGPACRFLEVKRIATPGIGLQGLFSPNQAGAHRIQMHIVAHGFEVT